MEKTPLSHSLCGRTLGILAEEVLQATGQLLWDVLPGNANFEIGSHQCLHNSAHPSVQYFHLCSGGGKTKVIKVVGSQQWVESEGGP